jgi:hypothetical protein
MARRAESAWPAAWVGFVLIVVAFVSGVTTVNPDTPGGDTVCGRVLWHNLRAGTCEAPMNRQTAWVAGFALAGVAALGLWALRGHRACRRRCRPRDLPESKPAESSTSLRGGTQEAELLALSVEAVRPRISADESNDAGIKRLRDPTAFEPGIVWYTAWGYRKPD